MEWNEKLQAIIDYVETHLQRTEEPLDKEEIEKLSGCSYPFFLKIFSYMNGISFAEYVRARKMTLAGYDLKSTSLKVIDISYKYGYDSPTSFTKAFHQFHGVSPKEARKTNVVLNITPKMQLSFQQKYSWKLAQKNSFRLIGKKIRVSCKDNFHFTKIPEFWNECQRDGTFAKLISMDCGKPQGLFGLFGSYEEEPEEIEYSIVVRSNQNLPSEFVEIIIPEVTWAIFDCIGPVPQAIQRGWHYLHKEWLIKYPFRHAPCPELEWYSDGNSYADNYFSQIWIPILEEES